MKQQNISSRKQQLIRNLNFNYDGLNDLLYVYKRDSSIYSNVVVGEFHLEFNKDRELIGLEVLNASGVLGEYGISKKELENIEKIELKTISRNNSLIVFLIIKGQNQEKSAAITMNNFNSPIMQVIEA